MGHSVAKYPIGYENCTSRVRSVGRRPRFDRGCSLLFMGRFGRVTGSYQSPIKLLSSRRIEVRNPTNCLQYSYIVQDHSPNSIRKQ